jgi:hypothetical protein
MFDEEEARAREEAEWLAQEFGAEAPLYAALRAQRAIEQRDFKRCVRWKRVLEMLDTQPLAGGLQAM